MKPALSVPRRHLLIALGFCALAAPLRATAQAQDKARRVGFLYFGSRQSATETGRYEAFLNGMREAGYVEKKNLVIEARFAGGDPARAAELAAELVKLRVDVIVAAGTVAHFAARKATASIPIVVPFSIDPVGEGWAASLARPGGNVTGLSTQQVESVVKNLELLRTIQPKLSRVAVLMNPANATHPTQLEAIQLAAQKARLEVVPVHAGSTDEIEAGFANMAHSRVGALISLGDAFFTQEMRRIADLALRYRLASTYVGRPGPEAGGLLSYGSDIRDHMRRSAAYVDKILKGARPGDLPIEQPTKFDLVINLRTAKALGITVSKEVLFRADKVIE